MLINSAKRSLKTSNAEGKDKGGEVGGQWWYKPGTQGNLHVWVGFPEIMLLAGTARLTRQIVVQEKLKYICCRGAQKVIKPRHQVW